MKRKLLFTGITVLLLLVGFTGIVLAGSDVPGTPSGDGVVPELVSGNPDCGDIGYGFGFKINSSPNGTFTLTNPPGELTGGAPSDPNNSVTIYNSDGYYFDWSATLGIDAVIVKAGDNADAFVYIPEDMADTDLHGPTKADGTPRNISHIEFCYDYEVTVSKIANTTFTRTWNWTIDKSVSPDTLDMFTGDSGTVQYTVAVDKTGYTDSDWAVSGTITIENNTPLSATITGVSDQISGDGSPVPTCGVTFPYTLAAGGTLSCSYGSSLPDGSSRTNTATVTTTGYVGGGSATAGINFGAPTTVVNDSINVDDSNGGSWFFSDDGSVSYSKTFTCNADEGQHANTATIRETGQSDDASVTVNCYALTVTKDASTSFTRTYNWTIDKVGDQTALTLSLGQQFLVNYGVTVAATYTDSDWAVAGNISVYNPAPIAATLNSISDVVSGVGAASVNCGVTFPYSLAAGGTLSCTYSADLPDASDRTNTATATLQNTPSGTTDFTGSADVSFDKATMTEVDECIDVSDTYAGTLGKVCYGVDTLPKTFTYSRWIGPYAVCGIYTVENIASFITNDYGVTGSDSWTVNVSVPCVCGCTLTQGYWKTHSEFGPAPYDETWALLPNGASTPFYLSGKTWYQVFWTSPAGNPYYNLAHQFMAANLNILNGAASTPEVDAALAWAHNFFNTHAPGYKFTKTQRANMLNYAGILDKYNNGYIGPGHCDE